MAADLASAVLGSIRAQLEEDSGCHWRESREVVLALVGSEGVTSGTNHLFEMTTRTNCSVVAGLVRRRAVADKNRQGAIQRLELAEGPAIVLEGAAGLESPHFQVSVEEFVGVVDRCCEEEVLASQQVHLFLNSSNA